MEWGGRKWKRATPREGNFYFYNLVSLPVTMFWNIGYLLRLYQFYAIVYSVLKNLTSFLRIKVSCIFNVLSNAFYQIFMSYLGSIGNTVKRQNIKITFHWYFLPFSLFCSHEGDFGPLSLLWFLPVKCTNLTNKRWKLSKRWSKY